MQLLCLVQQNGAKRSSALNTALRDDSTLKERAVTVKNVIVKVAMYLTHVMSYEKGHQYYTLPPSLDMIRIFCKNHMSSLLHSQTSKSRTKARCLIFQLFFSIMRNTVVHKLKKDYKILYILWFFRPVGERISNVSIYLVKISQ